MAVEHAQARERRAVPHLDGVVPQPERKRDPLEFGAMFLGLRSTTTHPETILVSSYWRQ